MPCFFQETLSEQWVSPIDGFSTNPAIVEFFIDVKLFFNNARISDRRLVCYVLTRMTVFQQQVKCVNAVCSPFQTAIGDIRNKNC